LSITFVQSKTAPSIGPATSQTLLFSSNVTVGNNIVVQVAVVGTTPAITSVTDSLGNTYTQQITRNPGGVRLDLWSAPVTTGGSCTITVSTGLNSNNFVLIASELHNTVGTLTYDVSSSGTGTVTTSSASIGTGKGSTPNSPELALVGIVADSSSTTLTPPTSPWIQLDNNTGFNSAMVSELCGDPTTSAGTTPDGHYSGSVLSGTATWVGITVKFYEFSGITSEAGVTVGAGVGAGVGTLTVSATGSAEGIGVSYATPIESEIVSGSAFGVAVAFASAALSSNGTGTAFGEGFALGAGALRVLAPGHALGVGSTAMSPVRCRTMQLGLSGIYGVMTAQQQGGSRIQNNIVGFNLYVGLNAIPDLTQAPVAFSNSLPFSYTLPLPGSGTRTYYILVQAQDHYGLVSQNQYYTTLTLDSSGNQVFPAATPPVNLILYAEPGSAIRVLATYPGYYTDASPATSWNIWISSSPISTSNPPQAVVDVNSAQLLTDQITYGPGLWYVGVALFRASDSLLSTALLGTITIPVGPIQPIPVRRGWNPELP
jgi:hypothetical protein